MTRLQEYFNSEIKPSLKEQLGYNNIMQVPKVDKIVLNIGIGEAAQDKKKIDSALEEMSHISGQKPDSTLHDIRKIAHQQLFRFAGSSLCGVEMKFLKSQGF